MPLGLSLPRQTYLPRQSHPAAALFALVAAVVTVGCDEPARPWSAPPSRSVVDATKPFLPAPLSPPVASAAGQTRLAPPASRVGGLWVTCYGGFQPGPDPSATVTQLGLLCGPANGMRRLGGLHEGDVRPGTPRHHRFRLASGSCIRVFGASAPSIPNLNVEVRVGDTTLGSDTGDDRWPIVQAERPLCFRRDSEVDVVVSSPAGRGGYALEVWRLSPQPPP